ncbi:MAG: replication-associated recombination protein A [Oscillospiraceae bacterium]|jgi:putative ATPase|nr:replication-associated recombination protein A [Oscillospiraceae bacterium]
MGASLASRIRPTSIEEIVGQDHLLGKEGALRKVVDSGADINLFFYGPPGTGKTTLAAIISQKTKRTLKTLNCTSANISDIKEIIKSLGTFCGYKGVTLYLDEIQYFSKKQQQTLLQFIEDGRIRLIASTTENPYFCIYNALLSRMSVFEFCSVEGSEIIKALRRAIVIMQKDCEQTLIIDDDTLKGIANSCFGDVRRAVNTLELAAISSEIKGKKRIITKDLLSKITRISNTTYDKSGDSHYDLLSAFQKSIRGSDPDAALHYLARLLESGDLNSVCRRLLVCACEDVGLAYPTATIFTKSCADIALQVGLPEARIPLADAVVLLCVSPKSNSAYVAIDKAITEVKSGVLMKIPRHLQNKHCDGECNDANKQYKYPHDFKSNYTKQQYLPDELKQRKYYEFGENKIEQSFKRFHQNRIWED